MGQAGPGMRWRALTAVGALLVAGLAGCDGGDAPTPAPLEPLTSSASPTEPSESPAPTMPAEAQGTSVAAAKSFARYFIGTINHALSTGDVRPLKDASEAGCVSCNVLARNISRVYAGGGHIESEGWTVDAITAGETAPRTILVLGMSFGREEVFRPDEETTRHKPSRGSFTTYLTHGSEGWRVQRLVLVQ
jgi:uncharacterized protein DUF6318